MTVITRQEVATYAAMIQRMQDDAAVKSEGAVRRWMSLHPDCTPAELRNATIAIVDDVVAASVPHREGDERILFMKSRDPASREIRRPSGDDSQAHTSGQLVAERADLIPRIL